MVSKKMGQRQPPFVMLLTNQGRKEGSKNKEGRKAARQQAMQQKAKKLQQKQNYIDPP